MSESSKLTVEPPVNWLVYATPDHVMPRLTEAVFGAGLRLRRALGPAASAIGINGTIEVQVRGAKSPELASWLISPLPGESAELTLRPRPADVSGSDDNEANLLVKWQDVIARFRSRLQLLGIRYEDLLAPGYTGPRGTDDTRTTVRKPSERSMWVDPLFYGRDFPKRDDLAFVIMPFSAPLDAFYGAVVKPVVQETGLQCERADDITAGLTNVMEDIWAKLNEARFVVADLTDRNPNVYYELGIANTLGKRVIAIHKKVPEGESVKLPFDVQSQRVLFYEDSAAGAERFKSQLRAHIKTILESGS
jgi:hypothetical protein